MMLAADAAMMLRRWLVILVILMAMSALGLLRDVIRWLNGQGGFTQTVVGGGVLAVGGVLLEDCLG